MLNFLTYCTLGILMLIIGVAEAWLVLVSLNFVFHLNIHIDWITVLAAFFLINRLVRQTPILNRQGND